MDPSRAVLSFLHCGDALIMAHVSHTSTVNPVVFLEGTGGYWVRVGAASPAAAG